MTHRETIIALPIVFKIVIYIIIFSLCLFAILTIAGAAKALDLPSCFTDPTSSDDDPTSLMTVYIHDHEIWYLNLTDPGYHSISETVFGGNFSGDPYGRFDTVNTRTTPCVVKSIEFVGHSGKLFINGINMTFTQTSSFSDIWSRTDGSNQIVFTDSIIYKNGTNKIYFNQWISGVTPVSDLFLDIYFQRCIVHNLDAIFMYQDYLGSLTVLNSTLYLTSTTYSINIQFVSDYKSLHIADSNLIVNKCAILIYDSGLEVYLNDIYVDNQNATSPFGNSVFAYYYDTFHSIDGLRINLKNEINIWKCSLNMILAIYWNDNNTLNFYSINNNNDIGGALTKNLEETNIIHRFDLENNLKVRLISVYNNPVFTQKLYIKNNHFWSNISFSGTIYLDDKYYFLLYPAIAENRNILCGNCDINITLFEFLENNNFDLSLVIGDLNYIQMVNQTNGTVISGNRKYDIEYYLSRDGEGNNHFCNDVGPQEIINFKFNRFINIRWIYNDEGNHTYNFNDIRYFSLASYNYEVNYNLYISSGDVIGETFYIGEQGWYYDKIGLNITVFSQSTGQEINIPIPVIWENITIGVQQMLNGTYEDISWTSEEGLNRSIHWYSYDNMYWVIEGYLNTPGPGGGTGGGSSGAPGFDSVMFITIIIILGVVVERHRNKCKVN